MYYVGLLHVDAPVDRQIVLTRVFDAPKTPVFNALVTPALLRRWLGPNGWSLDMCESDLRVGGTYRFRARGPCGTTIRWHGIYLDIENGERIVQTESYDDWHTDESVVTTALSEHEGTTTLTATVVYPSQQLRDAVLNCGMTRGLAESYDKLSELLHARVIA